MTADFLSETMGVRKQWTKYRSFHLMQLSVQRAELRIHMLSNSKVPKSLHRENVETIKDVKRKQSIQAIPAQVWKEKALTSISRTDQAACLSSTEENAVHHRLCFKGPRNTSHFLLDINASGKIVTLVPSINNDKEVEKHSTWLQITPQPTRKQKKVP